MDRACAGALLAAAVMLTAAQARAAAEDPATQTPQAPPAQAKKSRAVAASAAATAPRPAAPASTSVVINLIRLLVQEGVLTQDKANTLIRQAEDEAAAAARGQVAAVPAPAVSGAPAASTSVRVPYIPEIVKRQIRDEVKQEVIQQARAENWAAPDALPEWTKRIKLSGDIRLRYEWDQFDQRNANTFVDFNTLNSGNPYNLNDTVDTPLPTLDTTTNRERMRERFRLGLDAEVSDTLAVGLRLATGNTTNPVSTNQTLGNSLANDSFNLDRAFLRYQPASWLTLLAGRFANPWLSTDLVWDDDLNFDGAAVKVAQKFGDLTPFFVGGAFPLANTVFNFPSNSLDKQDSRDKWLFGAQLGTDWRPDTESDFKIGLAYYHYRNVEGTLSAPCNAITASIPCNTDGSRPTFIQQGNTLFAIRNVVIASGTSNPPLYEYFGLASQFHELNLTARADFSWYDPIHVIADADFVTNLGFDRSAIAAKKPVNNFGPSADGTNSGPWTGGDNAFMARLTVGYPVLRHLWDWNVTAGYKYIESDSVVDAFDDSEFHLGGTNAKGYFIGGGIGIDTDFDLSARWYSAREVSGAPYSVDVIQLDLNGRF